MNCEICKKDEFECRCAEELGRPILQDKDPMHLIDEVNSLLNGIVSYMEDIKLSGVMVNDIVLLRVQCAIYRCMQSYRSDMAKLVREIAEITTKEGHSVQSQG